LTEQQSTRSSTAEDTKDLETQQNNYEDEMLIVQENVKIRW